MPRHTLVADIADPGATRVTIVGDEAKHAIRVKRVREGDTIRVLDGKGHAWQAGVLEARKSLVLELGERDVLPDVRPRLELATATPKGGRVDKMIDQLGQLGVAAWRPLNTQLGVVEPGANKLERLRRIADETVKQAVLPRPLRIEADLDLHAALEPASFDGPIVVADAMGKPYDPTGADHIRLLIGPEGGFTEQEYESMSGRGVRLMSLGTTVLRIETAAVAAASVMLDQERRAAG
jgi:16S rRNA (uracil1498-N3)-methyltransferase